MNEAILFTDIESDSTALAYIRTIPERVPAGIKCCFGTVGNSYIEAANISG